MQGFRFGNISTILCTFSGGESQVVYKYYFCSDEITPGHTFLYNIGCFCGGDFAEGIYTPALFS
jgi:hypothetical protein